MGTVVDLSDDILLKQCIAGNESAFNVLFRRYFDDLLQFAVKQLKNQELAEELVMDLMIKLWQRPADFLEIQQLSPYLYRSVKNAIISQWRKKALELVPLDDLTVSTEPLARSADYKVLATEANILYREKLNELSPQRRLIYTMSREQDMSHSEIADETGLSVNTVKNHLKASLGYFRENLKTFIETGLVLVFYFFC